MNCEPLVSVITVSYNSVATIEQTIQSVLTQSYSNIEYLIIDGGSTDGTLDIINKYRDQIAVIISEPDRGIYDAMNKGINHSKGDLIGIINSDDWYESCIVEEVVNKYISMNWAEDIVYYGIIRIWKEGKEYAIRRFHHNFLNETVIQHPTCFIPKKIYQKYGSFKDTYRIAGDFDLLNRFKRSGVSFCNIDKVLANFRIGGASSSLAYIGAIEYLEIKFQNGFITKKMYVKQRFIIIFFRYLKKVISFLEYSNTNRLLENSQNN